ncbi:uncharacterized protein LOC105424924 [Pogonomyrmex barbatus]|uniref:Uncharacterized protein LOC105424924 n=1 Tax=Pogonomyrmex barbatus TaxID=144034 RepID=A0A6I9VX22_9HYME|nr:uncharacterized protein LOC105424924 [Pogonomyrmex barbatus]
MESKEGVFDSDISETDVQHNRDSFKSDGKEANAENVRVLSVDKVTVEKIVLESSNGSREVLLTKNETSRKLSLSSETKSNVVKCVKDERQKSTCNDRFRVSIPEDAFTKSKNIASASQSKLPVPKSRKNNGVTNISREENRIKPIKFVKSPSVGSAVTEGSNTANAIVKKSTVPPKIPEKSLTNNKHNSSLVAALNSSTKIESSEDLSSKEEKVVDRIAAEVKQAQTEQEVVFETENTTDDKKGDISSAEIERRSETFESISKVNRKRESDEIEKQDDDVESRGGNAGLDRDVQDRLEKSQATIEDLQKNLSTKIHASTAQSYKEKLLGLQANYALKPAAAESNCSERLSSGFDKDFLERHNLDRRLKIEERRVLETDLDYTSENERASETDERPSRRIDVKRKYSEKVTEVEKRWSGEFLDNRLQRNSSESSKSSYIEEFGSVSSRESIVEDRDARVLFDRKHPEAKFTERQASIDESKRQTSEEILENSTVSTVDSDSCLEDRIKAVDEDIAQVTNEIQTDDNDDIDGSDQVYRDEKDGDCVRWSEKVERADIILTTTAIVHGDLSSREENIESNATGDPNSREVATNRKKNIEEARSEILLTNRKNLSTERRNDKTFDSFTIVNSKESIDPTTFVVRSHRGVDGYANLIKEFAMEAGSSKVKKEEKQKKKLGFRRLLPAIFSPKDSRKDYKKKEQKERRKYDERHFARYQQNGNYTRSPDTMNLNEDIKRNVKLDNSLNGSIIEERLDEIKRELFPEQGPITSTPDHFLQTDDTRLLRDRTRNQRSYTANSSLSSIAPDERWLERSGQFGISPDIRKYEQRQRREEQDSQRYGHLERKHSLQEPNHSGRGLFQKNHAASGRISAPPSERYFTRSRAIHPVDRPLPEIPQSRIELSNYENYQDGIDQMCDNLSGLDVADNVNYRNQSELYQNDRNLESGLIHNPPQSVPAQVKITRQPIVNQSQRAPLIGRSSKYPSSGSSQKSGDSSCTPNSSQKSEFSPTSSKSGEYYLNSPRSSTRTSPIDRQVFEDARERVYENEGQVPSQPSDNYIQEHVYDETPSCREEHFPSTEATNHIAENLEKKEDDLVFQQKCLPSQQSPSKNCSFQCCEDNEGARTESRRETEKLRDDCLKNYENANTNMKNDSCNQVERTSIQSVSPSKTGMTIATSPSTGSRARRSQPDDQILIASPKRETICQSRVPRPSNEARFCDTESPVPIVDSREGISGIVPIEVRDQYGSQNSPITGTGRSKQRTALSCGFPKGISRPEPIYGHRGQPSSSRNNTIASEIKQGCENEQLSPRGPYSPNESGCDIDGRIARTRNSTSQSPQSCVTETKQLFNEPERRVARSPIREPSNVAQDIHQQRRHDAAQQQRTSFTTEGQQSSLIANQDKMYVSASSLQREPIYAQRQRQQPQQQLHQPQQQPRQGQEAYVPRVADATCGQQSHPPCGLLSPSKQETRQHLEAFYWQQKALEAHRKSAISSANAGPRQIAPRIDLPEMREAVYWQHLKKLDAELQRRIYEQNLMEDGLYETYQKIGSPMMSTTLPIQAFSSTAFGSVIHGDGSYWGNVQQQRPKISPTGKPPLMQPQKGQNQPVLIVRPQQALRDRQEMSIKPISPRDPTGCDSQRSKSASPHFHRGEIERTSFHVTCRKPVQDRRNGATSPTRKSEVGGVHEEDGNDGEVRPRPHPIFKRGSLVGGDSVEYGSTGPKRVSFSNQPNAGPDLATGSWPTKHGTAPEPPTRRHKSEDSASDTDSVFLHQDRHDGIQNVSYVTRNADPSSRCRSDGSCSEQEYDANRPLPPVPKDSLIISRRGHSARNYVCNDARWNNEEQRRRRQSEFTHDNPTNKLYDIKHID